MEVTSCRLCELSRVTVQPTGTIVFFSTSMRNERHVLRSRSLGHIIPEIEMWRKCCAHHSLRSLRSAMEFCNSVESLKSERL